MCTHSHSLSRSRVHTACCSASSFLRREAHGKNVTLECQDELHFRCLDFLPSSKVLSSRLYVRASPRPQPPPGRPSPLTLLPFIPPPFPTTSSPRTPSLRSHWWLTAPLPTHYENDQSNIDTFWCGNFAASRPAKPRCGQPFSCNLSCFFTDHNNSETELEQPPFFLYIYINNATNYLAANFTPHRLFLFFTLLFLTFSFSPLAGDNYFFMRLSDFSLLSPTPLFIAFFFLLFLAPSQPSFCL